jgi:hypothetical protein
LLYPTPTLTLSSPEREGITMFLPLRGISANSKYSLPFKGRVRVGMGWIVMGQTDEKVQGTTHRPPNLPLQGEGIEKVPP